MKPQTRASSVGDMPAFLVAVPGAERPVLKDQHRIAILQLTKEEALRIWTRCHEKSSAFPAFQSEENESDPGAAAKGLLLTTLKHGNGQKELVLAVMRDRDLLTESIAEKLTGHPIQRLPEKGAHAPRATRPQRVRPGQTFSGDDMTITVLSENNPRKAGTRAAMLFALYRTGMTVAEYVVAGGGRGNVKCDLERGNISLAKTK